MVDYGSVSLALSLADHPACFALSLADSLLRRKERCDEINCVFEGQEAASTHYGLQTLHVHSQVLLTAFCVPLLLHVVVAGVLAQLAGQAAGGVHDHCLGKVDVAL